MDVRWVGEPMGHDRERRRVRRVGREVSKSESWHEKGGGKGGEASEGKGNRG